MRRPHLFVATNGAPAGPTSPSWLIHWGDQGLRVAIGCGQPAGIAAVLPLAGDGRERSASEADQ
jgi:hypothetical protein